MEDTKLNIQAVVGFSGAVNDGLALHPDEEHLLYPLGSTIVVKHLPTKTQTFLRGHDNKISGSPVSTQSSR